MPFGYTDYGAYRVPDYTGGNAGPSRAGGGTVTSQTMRGTDAWASGAAAVGGALISGFFESRARSADRASADQRQAASARYQSYMQDVDRYNQLQDRVYAEGGAAAYRDRGPTSSGGQPIMMPTPTNPGTRPVDPYTRPRG